MPFLFDSGAVSKEIPLKEIFDSKMLMAETKRRPTLRNCALNELSQGFEG
jgi:hypothetical protein